MNYLIIGTGGVGGCIAGFLALAGKDVTCIARGKHLEAIRRQGLHLKSDLKGEHFLPVKACTAEEYQGKADVILVCVKGYSIDSIRPVLERAATPDTLVIPILNVYGTGPRIGRLVPSVKVLDGCIYIVGFVSGEGEISQMGSIFRLVFGARPQQQVRPNGWRRLPANSASAASRWTCRTTSTGIRSSNGRSSRPWPARVPITTCRWARCSTRVRCATRLSACRVRVRRLGRNWASPTPATPWPTT